MENLTSKAIPVAIKYERGMQDGWMLVLAFALIGLVNAILGETLAIATLNIFLISASAWIATSIALLAILYGPARRSDQT